MKILIPAVFLVVSASVQLAYAAPIVSAADPSLSGATTIDFESTLSGQYSALVYGDLTITSSPTDTLSVRRDIYGVYTLPNDAYLEFGTYGSNTTTFSFANNISAFGLQVGATNAPQTLTAYDALNNLIETINIPNQVATLPYPYTGYYGINAGSNLIARVVFSANDDEVVVDDVSFASLPAQVPEPITTGLLGIGLLGLATTRRHKK